MARVRATWSLISRMMSPKERPALTRIAVMQASFRRRIPGRVTFESWHRRARITAPEPLRVFFVHGLSKSLTRPTLRVRRECGRGGNPTVCGSQGGPYDRTSKKVARRLVELEGPNPSQSSARAFVRAIRRVRRLPHDHLGPEEVRRYQLICSSNAGFSPSGSSR